MFLKLNISFKLTCPNTVNHKINIIDAANVMTETLLICLIVLSIRLFLSLEYIKKPDTIKKYGTAILAIARKPSPIKPGKGLWIQTTKKAAIALIASIELFRKCVAASLSCPAADGTICPTSDGNIAGNAPVRGQQLPR